MKRGSKRRWGAYICKVLPSRVFRASEHLSYTKLSEYPARQSQDLVSYALQFPLAIFVAMSGKLPSPSTTIQPFISLEYLVILAKSLRRQRWILDVMSIGASVY